MLFSKKRELTTYEYQLVNDFLSHIMGKSKERCINVLHQEGYTLIDDWKSKVGFVREGEGKVFILTLHFENNQSHNYHLIIKNENEDWTDKRIIDFKYLKELNII